MELAELMGSEFILALIAMTLTLWFWRQSLVGLGVITMLRDFKLVRVLKRTDTELALLGNFKSDNDKKAAVLIIQTAVMDTGALDQLLTGMSLHEILVNDIYTTFQGDVSRKIKPYKVNLIYPATDTHVCKHTDQDFHMVVETKEIYQTITKPFIDSIPAEKMEWVYNILEHKSEMERIIYEDPHPRNGFVLLPDFKWSDPSNECKSGDLNTKFGMDPSSMRTYFHYQPSYYHLHVHFSHIKMTLVRAGTFSGKAVLLEDVIYNLSVNSEYYKNATLSFVVGEMQHQPLFKLFRDKNII